MKEDETRATRPLEAGKNGCASDADGEQQIAPAESPEHQGTLFSCSPSSKSGTATISTAGCQGVCSREQQSQQLQGPSELECNASQAPCSQDAQTTDPAPAAGLQQQAPNLKPQGAYGTEQARPTPDGAAEGTTPQPAALQENDKGPGGREACNRDPNAAPAAKDQVSVSAKQALEDGATAKPSQPPMKCSPSPQREQHAEEHQHQPQEHQQQNMGKEHKHEQDQNEQQQEEQEQQQQGGEGQQHQRHSHRQEVPEQGVQPGKRSKTCDHGNDCVGDDGVGASGHKQRSCSTSVVPWNKQAQSSRSTPAFASWRATQAIRARRNRRKWTFYKNTKAETVAATSSDPEEHPGQQQYLHQGQYSNQQQPQQAAQRPAQRSQQASVVGVSHGFSAHPSQRLGPHQLQRGAGHARQEPQPSPIYGPQAYALFQQQQQQLTPTQQCQHPRLQPQGQRQIQQPQLLPLTHQQHMLLQHRQQTQLQQQQMQAQQQSFMVSPYPRALPQDPSGAMYTNAVGFVQALQPMPPYGLNPQVQPMQTPMQGDLPSNADLTSPPAHPLVAPPPFADPGFAVHPGMAPISQGAARMPPNMYMQRLGGCPGADVDGNAVFPVRRSSGTS